MAMKSLTAHVKNGRLVLDESTDFPEGKLIDLMPVDDVLDNGASDSTTKNENDCTTHIAAICDDNLLPRILP